MPLFQWGKFTSHAGRRLDWKINCDALSPDDWICIAQVVSGWFAFGEVAGIPTGGDMFAAALAYHRTPGNPTVLIADDVYTTGTSMRAERAKYPNRPVVGVVLFSRAMDVPSWVEPVFCLNTLYVPEEKGNAHPADHRVVPVVPGA